MPVEARALSDHGPNIIRGDRLDESVELMIREVRKEMPEPASSPDLWHEPLAPLSFVARQPFGAQIILTERFGEGLRGHRGGE